MNVRRMPSAPPNSPASNTTLSRGEAWPPDCDASLVVQSSWANTNAAKSTSWESSTSRSSVERPGLNVVVHGSTSATSESPRSMALSSLACLPDDPRKIRGLVIRDLSLDRCATNQLPRVLGVSNCFVLGGEIPRRSRRGRAVRVDQFPVEATVGPVDDLEVWGHPGRVNALRQRALLSEVHHTRRSSPLNGLERAGRRRVRRRRSGLR